MAAWRPRSGGKCTEIPYAESPRFKLPPPAWKPGRKNSGKLETCNFPLFSFLLFFFSFYFWFCLAFSDVPRVSPIPAEVGGFDCLVAQMITRFGNGGGQENETTGLLQGERCPLDVTSRPSCPLPSLEGGREPASTSASAGAVTAQTPALDSLGEEDAKAHRGHRRRWP